MNLDKHSIARVADEAIMGMPHINAHYDGGFDHKHRRYSRDDDAMCAICGRPATDVHHVVELGMGGVQTPHNIRNKMGIFPTWTPLFALCRECHQMFTFHRISVEWKWDEGVDETPHILAMRTANDPKLFLFGRYVVSGDIEKEIRL